MDLSVLKNSLPRRMPAAMLLREDQETMSRILAQREDGVAESCLITEPVRLNDCFSSICPTNLLE